MSNLYTSKTFLSQNGCAAIHMRIYEPEGPPLALFQIVHGMAEHMGRYDDFARYLAGAGFRVCIHDQAGHGTSMGDEPPGFFAAHRGDRVLMEDVCTCGQLAMGGDELPIVLMGHSMGSFVVRCLAARRPDYADAMVLMGTGDVHLGVTVSWIIANLLCLTGQARRPSRFIDNMLAKWNLRAVDHPRTKHDWISHNPDNIAAYETDPLCGFPFTAAGFRDLFRMTLAANCNRTFQNMCHTIPILLISGEDDPVGRMGSGVEAVCTHLKGAGCRDVTVLLLPHMRHEPLHERDSHSTYTAISDWVARCKLLTKQESQT